MIDTDDSYTGTISAGTVHPDFGAVPPNGTGTVIISTPDAVATYTPTSLTVATKNSNTTISSNGLSSGSGYTYTTGTGGGTPWATNTTLKGGQLELEGKDADVIIDGKSLLGTLRALEQRLNILVPNTELEAEWSELKQLGDAYRKLEEDLIEKARMWQVLQKTL
jgi:hypothetical protein